MVGARVAALTVNNPITALGFGRGRCRVCTLSFMLRRHAKRRATQVDAYRWAMVESVLEPGETQIENTPCKVVFEDDGDFAEGCLFPDRSRRGRLDR